MNASQKLIIDVRTREEFVQNHIEGSLNIPLHDLELYFDFLKDKVVSVYCNSGVRATLAKQWLNKKNIKANLLSGDWEKDYSRKRQSIIMAINYLEIEPAKEKEFQNIIAQLCQKTNEIEGFLGSKLLKMSGISGIGSFLPANLTKLDVMPKKFIIITYWKNKKLHEKSHKLKFFKDIYEMLPSYSTQMPYEEFYDILK